MIEEAIGQLDDQRPVQAIAAGRTDAGVHAAGQVVHFDCCGPIPARRWAPALNGRLPSTIRVRESVERPQNWHACHSAINRRYRYTIYNGRTPNLFVSRWSWHRFQVRLDENIMNEVLQELVGLHDFAAFQKAGSQRTNSLTTIQHVDLKRQGDILNLEIQASGFLYGMVRLLAAQVVAVGEHRLHPRIFKTRWQEKRRSEVKEAAPAKGLCLLRAGYEEEIFSHSGCHDSQPLFDLAAHDSPKAPPNLEER